MHLWLFLFFASLLFSKPLDVKVHAPSAILMNADTGAILFEKNAHAQLYPASTTKVATALCLLEETKGVLDKKATVSEESLKMKSKGDPAYGLETDGTMMQLVKGEIHTYESLLHGLMLCSGNDAANVLAESAAGSVSAFVEKMNAHAKNLGCRNTHFSNPHGLHHKEHYSTAYDMCVIAKAALKHPKIKQVASSLFYDVPKTNKQPARQLKQQNKLIKEGVYYYPKAIGLKTGFHSAAKYTLVSAAEHEGRTLVAAIMGTEKSGDRYLDARALFEAAFAEKKERRKFLALDKVFSREIEGAKTSLRATLRKEMAIEYYPAEEPFCKAFVHWNVLPLPIAKGQKVGEVHIVSDTGALLQKGELFACEEVKSTLLFRVKKALFR